MERFKLISAVHLFLIKDNQILLLKRANTGYEDGNYSVPAGHLDGNETATFAAAREALEETTLKINPQDLELTLVMHRKGSEERIDFFFTTKKWLGEPKIGEPGKCDDLIWFDINKLPENTIPYIKHAIDLFQKKIIYSEFGWQ